MDESHDGSLDKRVPDTDDGINCETGRAFPEKFRSFIGVRNILLRRKTDISRPYIPFRLNDGKLLANDRVIPILINYHPSKLLTIQARFL